MIHHPVLLGTKAVLLLIIIAVLIVLHGILPPEQFRVAFKISIGVFVLSVVAIWTVFFTMLNNPNSKLSKSIVLNDASQENTEQKARQQKTLAALIGTEGIAQTPLRPCGIGHFNGQLIDVTSDRTFIDKDEKITVVAVEGKKVKVKKT